MGLAQSAGAALKSAHERSNGGSSWRSAYLEAGRSMPPSLSGGAAGAHAHGGVGVGSREGGAGRHVVSPGAALRKWPADARGDPAAAAAAGQQIPSSVRLGGKRPPGHRSHAGAGAALSGGGAGGVGAALSASSSSHPSVGAGGMGAGVGVRLAPSPGPGPQQFDGFGGPGQQREHSSRGGGGSSMGQFVNNRGRGNGNGRPVVQSAPMLDLEELMSGQDDHDSRSEWDDVLASVSIPHVGAEPGMGRSESPGDTRG